MEIAFPIFPLYFPLLFSLRRDVDPFGLAQHQSGEQHKFQLFLSSWHAIIAMLNSEICKCIMGRICLLVSVFSQS